VDQDWEGISSSLEEIRRSFLSRNGCIVNMTADGKSLTNTEKYVGKFLDLLPENPSGELVTWDARLPLRNEAIVIPTQVNKMKTLLYILCPLACISLHPSSTYSTILFLPF